VQAWHDSVPGLRLVIVTRGTALISASSPQGRAWKSRLTAFPEKLQCIASKSATIVGRPKVPPNGHLARPIRCAPW